MQKNIFIIRGSLKEGWGDVIYLYIVHTWINDFDFSFKENVKELITAMTTISTVFLFFRMVWTG